MSARWEAINNVTQETMKDVRYNHRPIPVARPLLPTLGSVAPYLAEIDQNRMYSNFGPLCQRFESRLAAFYGVSPEAILTVANATAGLTCALLAVASAKKGFCYLPSWTFCASAHAAILAGFEPYFLDVDPQSWQLTPAAVRSAVEKTGERGTVMVVAPFGGAVNVQEWDDFSRETGMKVVIDAAAAFASQKVGLSPVVVSLHATKALGVGEGGFVTSHDTDLISRIKQNANFGFRGSRTAEVHALNGKLSEFGAAVGLAALDCWPQTLRSWLRVQRHYWERLYALDANIKMARPSRAVSSTLVARFPVTGEDVREAFAELGIESLRWWGHGCHRDPAFENYPRESLPVTCELAEHTLGLPLFVDMTTSDIDTVIEGLLSALRRH